MVASEYHLHKRKQSKSQKSFKPAVIQQINSFKFSSPNILCHMHVWYTCVHIHTYIRSMLYILSIHVFRFIVLNIFMH